MRNAFAFSLAPFICISLIALVGCDKQKHTVSDPVKSANEIMTQNKHAATRVERIDIMPREAWSIGNIKPGDTVAISIGLVALSPESYREWKETNRFKTTVRLEKEGKLLTLPNGTKATFLGATDGRYHLRIAEGDRFGAECYTDESSIGEPKKSTR